MSFGFPTQPNSETLLSKMTAEKLSMFKQQFAYQLLRNPSDTLKAALKVFGNERVIAHRVHNEWPNDPEVVNFCRKWEEELGEEHFLPTKVEYLNKVWDRMNSKTIEDDDFARIADIYAKARDFYPNKKAAQASQVNIAGDSAKIMIVQTAPSQDDWEKDLALNQAKLQSFNFDDED